MGDKIESRRRLQAGFMALPEPCLLFLIIFSMKKWNFSGRALSKEKRKDHAE
jgi:hypothetical protein